MSWFDATSFTSYAKTAFASAQKSIDKVLDIDDGEANSGSTRTTNKASKADKVETTPKSSNAKPTSVTPRTSREKLTVKNDDSQASGDDFWSSFLGSSQSTSPSPPSSSSSSSSSTNKVSPPKKSSRHREILSRQKSDSKLINEKSKIKGIDETTENKDIQKDSEKDIVSELLNKPEVLETSQKEINAGKTARENEIRKSNESPSVDEPSLNQQSHEELSDKTPDNDSNGAISRSDESLVEVSLVNETDELENTGDADNENNVISQEVRLDSSELINENNKLSVNEEEQYLETTNEQLEFSSTDEPLQTHVNKSVESIPEPMATSTPYSCKETFKTDSKLKSTELTVKHDNTASDDLDMSREVELECVTQGSVAEDRDKETEHSSRKQPTEDDCEEEVIKGVMYIAEDDTLNQEGNMSELITDDITSAESSFEIKQPVETDLVQLEDPVKEDGIVKSESLLTVSVDAEVNDVKRDEHQVEEDRSQNDEQVQQLHNEISSLKEVVNARESKMVALSKENIDLQETNAVLRSQIDQLENMHAGENEEFEEMREEFTTRIAGVENKLHQVSKDRDEIKADLDETTTRLTANNERQNEEFSTSVAEKDEQIAQLLTEGEKLSKQELQSNTVIKKLRAKEKENDSLIKKQTNKLQEYELEVKRLTEILTSRDDSNSKQEDAIIKLNAYVKKQEEQLAKETSELEDANERVRSMQVALDNAYKEMTTLQKQTASTEGTIKEAVLSSEMKAKEDLRMALEKTRREFHQESEMMALQVADLQSSLSRTEQQGTRREENLRQEIKHLQQRLQEAEDRNQELATNVSYATRPLLRQIENLQTTHNGQTSTWERVEKNLTERLNEAQNQLLVAQEKERVATQSVSELNTRITRLESQVNSYRAERSRLEADLELERTKNGTLEDAQSRETAKYNAMAKKYQKIVEDANLDKAHLEQQLTVEKSKMETEMKKLKNSLEDKQKILTRQSSFGSVPPPSPSASSESFPLSQQQETTDNPSYRSHARTSSTSSSVVDGLARGMMGGSTALVERLQAQVKQKDGEIELLQDDVTSLRQSRDSVMEEMTSLTTKLEETEKSQEKWKDIKERYDVLQKRYNAVLQMYGEKEEEAEELRMDLQDVKNLYKQQLEQLFGSSR